MTKREAVLLTGLAVVLLVGAVLVGIVTDRLILSRVATGPPQRLAAAMGGLFAGGLVFFAGMITWFVKRAG